MIHANLGAYFAQNRILTVIVTYRLLPNVIFPGGSEDIRDALHWIVDNLKDEGDVTNITVLGHSAGGVHLSGVLLLPSLCTEKIKGCVKGVIFVGVPFEVGGGLDSEYRKNAEMYYGGVKKIGDRQPMGLLRRLERDHVERLPKIWNVVAEREPRRVASSAKRFSELVRAKLRSGDQEFRSQSPSDEKTRCDQRDQAQKIDDVVLEGHDHVSPIVSLSTGNERLEKWGLDVVNWVFELASCTTPTGGVHTEGFR